MKKTFIFGVIATILSIYQIPTFAQDIEEKRSDIVSTKTRLLILSSKGDTLEPYSIDNEVTSIITSAASDLGRFTIIDRNSLDNILKEQALEQTGIIDDSTTVNFGKISGAKEALIVSVLHFSQKGIPELDVSEEGCCLMPLSLIKLIIEAILYHENKEEERYPDNIETQLSVQVRQIDIETGQTLHVFDTFATHTGGTKGKSRAAVLKKLKKKITNKLKELYLLKSEVISVDNDKVLLSLGKNIGVRKGTVFEIIEPDEIRTFRDKKMVVPGDRIGFVSVTNVSDESNYSKILRQWRPIKPGYKALEFTKSIVALQFKPSASFTKTYYDFGLQFVARPKHKFGLGLHYVMATDTYNDINKGFGLDVFGSLQFFNSTKLDLDLKLGFDFDFFSRYDDNNQRVSCVAVTAPVGICANIFLSPKSDIIIETGYRLGGKTDNWKYKRDEESISATWKTNPPEIDVSGFYLSAGYRLFLF